MKWKREGSLRHTVAESIVAGLVRLEGGRQSFEGTDLAMEPSFLNNAGGTAWPLLAA